MASDMHRVIIYRLLLFQLVSVARAEDPRKNIVEGLLLSYPRCIHLLKVEDILLPQIEVDSLLFAFVVKVHVHQRVALVRDEHPINVL